MKIKKIYKELISIILLIACYVQCSAENNKIKFRTVLEEDGQSIPRYEREVIETYKDKKGRPLPVVFRGAGKSWPVASWSHEYLAKYYGNNILSLTSRRLLFQEYKNTDAYDICTTLSDYISDIQNSPKGESYYYATSSVDRFYNVSYYNDNVESKLDELDSWDLEEHLNNIFMKELDLNKKTNFPYGFDLDEDRFVGIFIGGSNTITDMHAHGAVFLLQVYGEKLVTLVSPEQGELLYCTLEYDNEYSECTYDSEGHQKCVKTEVSGDVYFNDCLADIIDPDFEKYPSLLEVKAYQTVMQPGDILYIPKGWLHDVRAKSVSISIVEGS